MPTAKDRPIPSGVPRGFRGAKQMDGTTTTQFTPPMRKAPMADRPPVPSRASDSGIESAMGQMADKMHSRR